MRQVAIVNPELGFAGPDTVAVWLLNALKKDNKVTLITADTPDFEKLNSFFSCNLDNSIEVIVIPIPKLLNKTPRARLLKQHLLMRYCKKNKNKFDVFISAYGEMDFGKKGIQYVHFPEIITEAKMVLTKRFYKNSMLRNLYQKVAWCISGYTVNNVKENVTLANSDWTKKVVDDLYGIHSSVLYPPVLDDFDKKGWHEKDNGFVYIGRMSPDKRPWELIQIIKAVRQEGLDVHIHLLGNVGLDLEYVKKIEEEAKNNPSWVFYEGKVSRKRLIEVVSSHKYGISGKKFEHFGIAVAEIVKAGNIMFINNDGGQVDIVGRDQNLIYNSDEEAVSKIARMIRDEGLQKETLGRLEELSMKFSVENFIGQTRDIVKRFLEGKSWTS